MEEWFRKLKLLHWTCIERDDRTSPFVCFDDDGGGDGGDGGDDDDDDDDDDDPENDYASFDQQAATTMEMSAKESSPSGTGSSFGAGGSEAATGIEAGNTAFEGWEAGTTGGPGMEGQSLESGTGAGAGYGGGADTGGGATAGGSGTGGGSTETAGLEGGSGAGAGAGIGGGGTQDSQGGGGSGSGGGVLDLFDLPPIGKPRSKEELDKEFEREFQQQFAPQQQPSPLPPPPQFNAPTPVSNRVSQAPIAPGVLPSGAVANPFGNPPTDPTKDQSQLPQGRPGLDFTIPDPNAPQAPAPPAPPAVAGRTGREGTAKEKEDDLRDSPFGQQTAFNPFGFNFTSPPGFNTAPSVSGMPTGAPQGAPPPDQQVAQGPPAPPLGTSVQTTPYAQTLADLVTTGPPGRDTSKGDREVREGRTDPFGKDAQNPNIFDPNTFTPSVGMLMAGINSMPAAPNPNSAFQTGAAPFGPQAPTQASPQVAQGRDPTIFDPTAIQSQGPPSLQGLQATQQQTPPNVASVIARSGQPQVAQGPQPEQFTREQLAIMTDPRALQPYAPPPPPPVATAPPPSRTVDIPSHNQYEWPAQAPGRNFTVDASGNLSFAPAASPTGREPGPAAITDAMPTGGVPLGDLPGGGFSPSQAGGGSGVVQLPPQRQQLSAQRRKPDRTTQAGRDAITEALMRRDLNAPGVSDFDRLRLQP